MFLLAERFPGDPALVQRLHRIRNDATPAHTPQTADAIPPSPPTPPKPGLARRCSLIVDHQLEAPHADVTATGSPFLDSCANLTPGRA
ncbi:hypothetical protein ACTMU2_19205 [Cupriavidus basilensis]